MAAKRKNLKHRGNEEAEHSRTQIKGLDQEIQINNTNQQRNTLRYLRSAGFEGFQSRVTGLLQG
jgi:hypothetical protein